MVCSRTTKAPTVRFHVKVPYVPGVHRIKGRLTGSIPSQKVETSSQPNTGDYSSNGMIVEPMPRNQYSNRPDHQKISQQMNSEIRPHLQCSKSSAANKQIPGTYFEFRNWPYVVHLISNDKQIGLSSPMTKWIVQYSNELKIKFLMDINVQNCIQFK